MPFSAPPAQDTYYDHPAFPFVIIAAAILVLVSAFVLLRRVKRKRLGIAEQMLQQWAASHGLILLERQSRWTAPGVFAGWSNTEHSFWRIVVQFPDGSVQQAWAWCGFWLAWMHFPKVDVRWDQVPAPVLPPARSLCPPEGKSFGQMFAYYLPSAFMFVAAAGRFIFDRSNPDQTWSLWTYGTWQAILGVILLIAGDSFRRRDGKRR